MQDQTAAADVQKRQPLEGVARLHVPPKPLGRPVTHKGQSRRIEFVQRREGPPRVPPLRRLGREARDVGRVDRGAVG